MDPGTGKLFNVVDTLTGKRREVTSAQAQERGLVPVIRDLRQHERARMQIALYAPCACGSGKKLKFCCYRPRAASTSSPQRCWFCGSDPAQGCPRASGECRADEAGAVKP